MINNDSDMVQELEKVDMNRGMYILLRNMLEDLDYSDIVNIELEHEKDYTNNLLEVRIHYKK